MARPHERLAYWQKLTHPARMPGLALGFPDCGGMSQCRKRKLKQETERHGRLYSAPLIVDDPNDFRDYGDYFAIVQFAPGGPVERITPSYKAMMRCHSALYHSNDGAMAARKRCQ